MLAIVSVLSKHSFICNVFLFTSHLNWNIYKGKKCISAISEPVGEQNSTTNDEQLA